MTDRGSKAASPTLPVPSGGPTGATRVVLLLSRIWAWVFLALMVLFFVIAVPVVSGGSVKLMRSESS